MESAIIFVIVLAILVLMLFWLSIKAYATDGDIIGKHGCLLTSTKNNDYCDGEKDSHSSTVNLWHSSKCTNKSVLSDCTKL